eukprot:CAMPEP_0198655890 /NCGR_PEP_ID=MMETSP1467-20131203/8647_1 /TAXON_ID=1462469 /ORGANISM="unid. sp., Strain CCMP2135" /LENGTH=300 /DNA_ID=CAMNT_0044391903 /DNA_START=53 /DNA_END=955 /DNA_ORIENTATION=+
MARNEEKAQLMLNRWVSLKKAFSGGAGTGQERRPFLASECHSVTEAEKWRLQIVRNITRKVTEIQNVGLGEHKIRDLNDQINKLLRERSKWQKRIRELGGPDYAALEPPTLDADGKALPGGGGYKYFGAARQLPGVAELFQSGSRRDDEGDDDDEPSSNRKKKRKTRADLNKDITSDYYGFRDEFFCPDLVAVEAAKEKELKAAQLRREEEAAAERRRLHAQEHPDEPYYSSDDDPALETAFLDDIKRMVYAESTTSEPTAAAVTAPVDDEALASRKRDLLAFLDQQEEALNDDDDDDAA